MTKMTEEKLKIAIADSISVAEVIKKLDMSVTTSNYRSFHNKVKLYNIDTSHFLGQGHLRGKNHDSKITIPLEEILVENSTYLDIAGLKRRLLANGILKYECAETECGISIWKEQKLSLQLDHINGIHNDHRIENLRLLCPNCHSQTDTFAGRNKKSDNTQLICQCGNEKRKESETCAKCAASKREKIAWPLFEDLLVLVKNQGYSKTAEELGVSRTSIKKKLAYNPRFLNQDTQLTNLVDLPSD